jgi:hypothetical protein
MGFQSFEIPIHCYNEKVATNTALCHNEMVWVRTSQGNNIIILPKMWSINEDSIGVIRKLCFKDDRYKFKIVSPT